MAGQKFRVNNGLLTDSDIRFEGSTKDGFETSLVAVDPTADQTIRLPDDTGYIAVFSTAPTSAITDGTNGQVLQTDGAGNLSFGSVASAYGDADVDTHLNTSAATSGQYLGWNGSDYAWSTVDVSTKLDLSGGTMTGDISFEGSTDDAFETTLTVTDPTADRTITLPDASGTVTLEGALTAAVTNAKDIVPASNALYQLGSYSAYWAVAYIQTVVSTSVSYFTDVTINGEITFEGATADANETVLTVTDPTADRTITLPDASGIVATRAAAAAYANLLG